MEIHDLHKKDIAVKEDQSKKSKMRSFDDCDNCIRYQRHIKLATESRKLYRLEKERLG